MQLETPSALRGRSQMRHATALPGGSPQIIYLLKMFPRFSETFILNEILGLEARGIRVKIFSLKKPNDGRFHAELAQLKARVRYIPEYVLGSPLDYANALLHSLWRKPGITISTMIEALSAFNIYAVKRWMQALWLTRELQDDPYTGVHCHFALSAPRVAYFLRKLNGNTYTFTAHAKDIFLKDTKGWLIRRKIAASRGVVTVCDYNLTYLRTHYAAGQEDKLQRIYNGIDLDSFAPPAFEDRLNNTILSVSRLVEKKGIDVLLQACALLKQRGVFFQCRIVGDGQCAPALRALSEQLRVQDCVEFTGALTQDHVREELRKCTLVAAPCLQAIDGNLDALPTSLLEALATGTPIVSTTVSGIPEIVASGEQGLLVEPGNVSQLADAIQRLLLDPERLRTFSKNGRERAQVRFDRKVANERIAEFLMDAHGPGGTPKLRVGYVLTVFPRLSETFIAREIRELERLGVHITIFSQKMPTESKQHDADQSVRARIVYLSPWWRVGIQAIISHLSMLLSGNSGYLESLRFVSSRRNLPNIKKFWRAAVIANVARSNKLQLLHCHFISANTRLGRFASQMSALQYSVTAHAKDIYASTMSEREMSRRLKEAAFVATISDVNKNHLGSISPSATIELVPNALDLRYFPFRDGSKIHDPMRVLAVGRLVPKKGFQILFEALAQFHRDGYSFEARIVGDGDEHSKLSTLARTLGIEDRLVFTGALSQEELHEHYDWADALVVPSISAPGGDVDGVPVVILEAMALGVPVIASRISGIPEVVHHGDTGVLVEPGDAVALTAALANMRKADVTSLTLRARAFIETNHDIRNTCSKLLYLIERAAGSAT